NDAAKYLDGTGAWSVPGGGSPTAGLFSGLLGTLPTSTNTGFATWRNQGSATVTDTAIGISLAIMNDSGSGTGVNVRSRSKAVPSTPYSCTFLLALNLPWNPSAFSAAGVGWTDGTKYQLFHAFRGASDGM